MKQTEIKRKKNKSIAAYNACHSFKFSFYKTSYAQDEQVYR